MSTATRSEWPEVVGSRCSIAVTAAWTNSSKSFRIRWMRSAFSKATAAWLASEPASSSSTEVKEMTCLLDQGDGLEHRRAGRASC